MRFAPFLWKKSTFQPMEQFSKMSLDGATIGARMAERNKKIWENGCKVCAHHFDHLEASWKKTSTTAFYRMYCRYASIFRYLVTGCHEKLSSSYRWYQKRIWPTFVRTESLLSRAIFKNCFGGFLYGMICSCTPMFKFFSSPPDGASTAYQISNREFSSFLHTYYCDFLYNVYR